MLAPHIPLANIDKYESLWDGVTMVFQGFGSILLHYAWFGWLVVLMLSVGGARLVWRFVRGIM